MGTCQRVCNAGQITRMKKVQASCCRVKSVVHKSSVTLSLSSFKCQHFATWVPVGSFWCPSILWATDGDKYSRVWESPVIKLVTEIAGTRDLTLPRTGAPRIENCQLATWYEHLDNSKDPPVALKRLDQAIALYSALWISLFNLSEDLSQRNELTCPLLSSTNPIMWINLFNLSEDLSQRNEFLTCPLLSSTNPIMWISMKFVQSRLQ